VKHPVSIIIPIYATTDDHFRWLDECVQHCIPQSDDIIVVMDGGVQPIGFVDHYPDPVRVYPTAHHGKSIARNTGVDLARNNLILPVDADDYPAANALNVMMTHWDGKTPVYSDIYKRHGDTSQPYPLLPFDCDAVLDKCISSIFVLHTKEQWKSIGGWNSELNLYEDWEYNSRLFWTYGAKKIDAYLYHYRQHSLQSTANAPDEPMVRQKVKSIIIDFARRNTMGCCGKKRSASAAPATNMPFNQALVSPSSQVQTVNLSLEADLNALGDPGPGNVWAKYLGARGMGPHSRRGLRSRKKYQRIMYGQTRAVKKEDTVSEEEFKRGASNCGLVRMRNTVAPPPAPAPVQHVNPVVQEAVIDEREPVVAVERTPPTNEELLEAQADLAEMSIRELKDYVKDVDDPNEITLLIAAEKGASHPRQGAIKFLEKTLQRMTS
jgi:hypothetical protein